MKLIATSIICLWSLATVAQIKSVRGRQFQLKGKIIGEVSLTPHCGTIAWGTVLEFEIIQFSDSEYKSETIAVIVTCPELYNDSFFQVGQMYIMTVADENQSDFRWSIPNESILKKYRLKKRLWMIEADRDS